VRDQDERKINARFAPQLVPRVLGTVPGITYIADLGRPRASEVVSFWPALISREAVKVRVVVGDEELAPGPPERRAGPVDPLIVRRAGPEDPPHVQGSAAGNAAGPADPPYVRVRLARLCLARSGDKGDTANIGVIGRSERIYAWMLDHLTPEFVKQYFGDLSRGPVERHLFPNLLAVNFLLHHSLGGGGTSSLLLDAQGKTYAQYLLAAEVEVPEGLIDADSRVAHRQE